MSIQQSPLATVYQYFTLDQWKAMVKAISNDASIPDDAKSALLEKFPSASLS